MNSCIDLWIIWHNGADDLRLNLMLLLRCVQILTSQNNFPWVLNESNDSNSNVRRPWLKFNYFIYYRLFVLCILLLFMFLRFSCTVLFIHNFIDVQSCRMKQYVCRVCAIFSSGFLISVYLFIACNMRPSTRL